MVKIVNISTESDANRKEKENLNAKIRKEAKNI